MFCSTPLKRNILTTHNGSFDTPWPSPAIIHHDPSVTKLAHLVFLNARKNALQAKRAPGSRPREAGRFQNNDLKREEKELTEYTRDEDICIFMKTIINCRAA